MFRRERNGFPYRRIPTTKCRRYEELEKSTFWNCYRNNYFRQVSLMVTKTTGSSMRSNIFLHNHKALTHKILNGENHNFAVEKSGWQHFNQVIKVSITSIETNLYQVPPYMMHWEEHTLLLCYSCQKMHWKTSYKINLQKFQGHERQRLKNCSKLKEIKRDLPSKYNMWSWFSTLVA